MSKLLVLIVEDDDELRDMLSRMVEKLGHAVLHAATGAEAVQLARRHAPQLILMDLTMPSMSGAEAVRLLKGQPRTRDIPVILVTGRSLWQSADELLRQGFSGYVLKPFTFDDIRTAIQLALANGGPSGSADLA